MPKIALAHDSFTQLGGAERVVKVFHDLYPQAPIFTLAVNKRVAQEFSGWNLITSSLQKWYNVFPKFQYYFPLIPFFINSLKVKGFNVLLSSSSSFIKNLGVPKGTIHINYCHTPTRFLWIDTNYAWEELPWFFKPLYPVVKIIINRLRKWDYAGAQRVSYFIANSKETQKRIKQFYNRDSIVIYPAIDAKFWKPTAPKSNYFLVAGRLQPHKKNELIIQIFNESGLPLHVVGTGRQESYLRSIAKGNIKFFGRVSDEELRDQYSGALGFIYPQIEDAGLMPLESAACGTASIGIARGGSLETIIPGVTGELFEDYDKEKIKQVILDWNPEKYQAGLLRSHAVKFGIESFKQQIIDFIAGHS